MFCRFEWDEKMQQKVSESSRKLKRAAGCWRYEICTLCQSTPFPPTSNFPQLDTFSHQAFPPKHKQFLNQLVFPQKAIFLKQILFLNQIDFFLHNFYSTCTNTLPQPLSFPQWAITFSSATQSVTLPFFPIELNSQSRLAADCWWLGDSSRVTPGGKSSPLDSIQVKSRCKPPRGQRLHKIQSRELTGADLTQAKPDWSHQGGSGLDLRSAH